MRGLDLISQQRGDESRFYLQDGHSGVRLLTDELGTVTDSYEYGAYGDVLSATGTTENPYLYRGESLDSELGLQYLRARYYEPKTGRFLSPDPFEGMVESPVSRHRYLYGNTNPVVFEDPSGEVSVTETVGSLTLLDYLAISAVSIGATGIIVSSTSRTMPQRGWPWQWTGSLSLGGLGLGNLGFAHLTSECYQSSGVNLEKEATWGLFGAGVASFPWGSLSQNDVVVVARTQTEPSVYDLFGIFGFLGAGMTIAFDTPYDIEFGSSAFRMGSGYGTALNGGTSRGFDVNLGGILGLSFPVYNVGDFPQPCTSTPS